MPHEPWSLHLKVLKYSREALPVVTVPLASPIEPLQEYPQGAVEELLEARAVAMPSLVGGIPPEFAVQLLKQHAEPSMASLLAPLGETLQGSPQLSAPPTPLQMRFPRSVPPPAKLKSQERKTALSRGLLAAEGEDAGLLGCSGEPKFLQAWPQSRVEPLRLRLVRKGAEVIIGLSE
jgi:hypothetical protein